MNDLNEVMNKDISNSNVFNLERYNSNGMANFDGYTIDKELIVDLLSKEREIVDSLTLDDKGEFLSDSNICKNILNHYNKGK